MKKTKVYLQYPWKFPDSPYYNYLIENPPERVKFILNKKQKGVIINKRFFWFSNFLKRNIRRSLNLFKITIPNTHLSPKGNYDLVHCAHCLSKNKNKPWVADIEMIPSLAISGWNTEKGIKKLRKILLRKNCKKILPWTESVKEELIGIFPEIENKIEVVYPAVPIKNAKPKKKKIGDKFKIIFIARYFDIKGGRIAIETLERLRIKYGIEGFIISNVPEELKKKYPKIKIMDLMEQEKLFDLMKKTDIFLYPSAVDTFGFALLEAMSFGIPIVTINTKNTVSRKEIIKNGENGFIFDVKKDIKYNTIGKVEKKIISELVENCGKLIDDKKLFEKISENNIKVIKEGKFSIKERNKKLGKIYREAIK